MIRLETLAVHGGQEPDLLSGSRAVPICQTTSAVFRDSGHAGWEHGRDLIRDLDQALCAACHG